MDYAAEDKLRDRAYSVWRQLSIEPPIGFADISPVARATGAARRRWTPVVELALHAGALLPEHPPVADLAR